MRMLFVFIVGAVMMGCGGGRGGAKPAGPAAAARAGGGGDAMADAMDYCKRYRGCAEERARMSWASDHDGKEPAEADLAAVVEEEVRRCRGILDGLTGEQQQWLEACTGCGGSCDAFRCLDGVPDKVAEPYQCANIDDPPPPEEAEEP